MALSNKIVLSLLIIVLVACSSAKEKTIDKSELKPITMNSNLEKNDDHILFITKAKRNYHREDEYLPSSEYFRVEIYNDKNDLIWNSSIGKSFMQMITDVLPKETGEEMVFQEKWEYRNNKKKRVGAGKYTAFLIIPAEPLQYKDTLEINLK